MERKQQADEANSMLGNSGIMTGDKGVRAQVLVTAKQNNQAQSSPRPGVRAQVLVTAQQNSQARSSPRPG
eukprot:1158573-Pyramimonas_sp.AAC.1